MRFPVFAFLFFCVALMTPGLLYAQAARNGVPSIFLDCQDYCYQEFLRVEMTYVNFMRDRADADILIQQTSLENGSGGYQVSLFYYGKKRFEGQNDTLVFNVAPAMSDNDVREVLRKYLDRGLVPYLLKTPVADRIIITMPGPLSDTVAEADETRDPWNFWTLSVDAYIDLNGQEISKGFRGGGGLRARRVTEAQKSNLYINGNYNRSQFDFGDGALQTFENGGYSAGGSQLMAINDHWSYGVFGNINRSLFRNLERQLSLQPGLEYNFFPYREATRRQFILRYLLGPRHNVYFEETIYFKSRELLWNHNFDARFSQVVEWGNFNLGLSYDSYLHDFRLNKFDVYAGLSLNLFKGFRLNFFGNYGLVHNQVELPNNGATKDEALLAIRQLRTGFSYFMYCNVSYTFGSIYSNVVNPRFD